jgi:hypothetical protein
MRRQSFFLILFTGFFAAFASENSLVLYDFENEDDFNCTKVEKELADDPFVLKCELSDENVTSGKKSLKIIVDKEEAWVVFTNKRTDWGCAYDKIVFDVYNPLIKAVTMRFGLSYWDSVPCGGEFAITGYPRHENSALLKPGKQTIEFSLKKLATIDSRFIDNGKLKKMIIGFSEKGEFWIDNVRLEKSCDDKE